MLRAIFNVFVDIFVPPRHTERLVKTLTREALFDIETAQGLPYQDPGTAALVWEIKYYGNRAAAALAGESLAPRILECMGEEIGVPLLIPVPMHAARLRERGHNQTELLCSAALAHLTGIDYAPRALERVVDTPHQQGLERRTRLRNVKNSMRARGAVKDRACIVIDDVTTTGATLEEARRALKKAGARSVHTVALAYS